ncbi:MAG: protein kinase, partial [Planctomycetes bacterium]|nr:protein kinase [Planctomycetota bacterium]
MSPADEDLLAGYVAEALDRRDSGEAIDPREICADHPHLATAVAEALGMVEQLPAMHADSIGADRWIGVTLSDRYELVERVGAGAMGAVYRARDRELDRDVAVKLLRHDLFVDDRAEQRFLREARSLAAVDHPHVVPIHDRGKTDEGVLFLVMAWIPGPSLAAVLELSRANIPRVEVGGFGAIDWLRDRLPVADLE